LLQISLFKDKLIYGANKSLSAAKNSTSDRKKYSSNTNDFATAPQQRLAFNSAKLAAPRKTDQRCWLRDECDATVAGVHRALQRGVYLVAKVL